MKKDIEVKLWECLDTALTMKGNGQLDGADHQLPSFLESALRRFFASKENLHKIKSMKANSSLTKSQTQLEMKVFKLKAEHFNPQPSERVPCCGQESEATVEAPMTDFVKHAISPGFNAAEILEQGVEEWSKQEFESLKDVKEWANKYLGTDFSDRSRKKSVLLDITEKLQSISDAGN